MNSRQFVRSVALLVVFLSHIATAEAEPLFETSAPQAFLVEANSGSVLFSKAPDQRIEPASLAKLMTMEIVFDALLASRSLVRTSFNESG